jgi:hypothetical protein
MTEPTTTLDERFSEPGTTAVPWPDTLRVIEEAELFLVTTVRADGRPHASPLVAVWLDGGLHFSTGPEEQKARNLAVHPHVLLSTGDSRWDGGLDVVVEGQAVRVTDPGRLRVLAEAWTRKWDGRWQFDAGEGGFVHEAGTAHVYRVEPAKVLAFGKGRFTHTSYRFPPASRRG